MKMRLHIMNGCAVSGWEGIKSINNKLWLEGWNEEENNG